MIAFYVIRLKSDVKELDDSNNRLVRTITEMHDDKLKREKRYLKALNNLRKKEAAQKKADR